MSELIQYYNQGGALMHILLACSIIAVAVIIERAVRLRRSALIDSAVVEDIQAHIERGQIDMAVARNRQSPSLVGRILSTGLEDYMNASTDIETALVRSGERGLQVLSNNLSVLNLIARLAPLIGLLGTVLGMIMGFDQLAAEGVGKERLADAIKVALITTAGGLMVAIPTIVANTYFRARIRRLQAEFEEIFIDIVRTVKMSPRGGRPASSDAARSDAARSDGPRSEGGVKSDRAEGPHAAAAVTEARS